MNTIATNEPVSVETLELVLGTGDLSKLTTQQRLEYYTRTCESLGLNPLTRPFRFMSLNGQTMMYPTRDCTDQLRSTRKINLAVVDKTIDGELFIVTVRARTPDGREDEDMGAVTIGRVQGEARANAIMKAITKAKRRVTLSICGLGAPDESEVETLPGVQTFDVEDQRPVSKITDREAINAEIPLRAAAAPAPRPARKTEQETPKARTDEQWRAWLDKLRAACDVLYRRDEVVEVANRPSVGDAISTGPEWVQREIAAILADNYARFPAEDETGDLPEVEIAGAEKMASG